MSNELNLTERSPLLVAKVDDLPKVLSAEIKATPLQPEGFLLRNFGTKQQPKIVLTALDDLGILYGTFRLLQLMQAGHDLQRRKSTCACSIIGTTWTVP